MLKYLEEYEWYQEVYITLFDFIFQTYTKLMTVLVPTTKMILSAGD